MKKITLLSVVCLSLLIPASLGSEIVASGFDKPLFLAGHNNDSQLLYVLEQRGIIWTIFNGERQERPFLDIRDRVHRPIIPGDERGLLGFAMSPDFEVDKRIYLNYVNKDHETVISRFDMDNFQEEIMLQFKQPYANHNGGMMTFGPDGYLYIAVGDGGSGGDPQGNAQNKTNLFGSILRIDVNISEGYGIPQSNPFINMGNFRPEIWAYGLRNPWRFSFDRETGDMYIGDVGQNLWEEINFQPGLSTGGENYGWNHYEGMEEFDGHSQISGAIDPIYVYPNDANIIKVLLGWGEADVHGCSVTGGYVYRGDDIPTLYGHYIFSDYCTGKIWLFKYENNTISEVQDLTDNINIADGEYTIYVSSFGEDADGELYIVDYNGSIYRITLK